MLPLQMVAMACMGAVYTFFVTHTYVANHAESAKQVLISAAKEALDGARKLLDAVVSRRPRHPEAWRPASSPRAAFTAPASAPTIEVVRPSVAPRPPSALGQSAMPTVVPQKPFDAPSLLSAAFEPRCFANDKNLTDALSPQCQVADDFNPRVVSASARSWSVGARTQYTTSIGSSIALAIVLLPCLMVLGSVLVRVAQRLGHYVTERHSPAEALVDDIEVIEAKTVGARHLEQLVVYDEDEERFSVPTIRAVATFPTTDLLAINTQLSMFTIECADLWTIPPMLEYSSLQIRIVPQETQDARGYLATVFTVGLLCKLDELKHSLKMIAPRPPPPFFDWSEFNIGEFLHCAERLQWTSIDARRVYRRAEALDWTMFNIRDFFFRVELVQVDWTVFNLRDFVHRAEIVQVDWTAFNIRDFVYRAELVSVDWIAFNIRDFIHRAELVQVDWTTFNIRDFVYRAEIVPVDWTIFNIRDFVHRAELAHIDWSTINVRQFLRSACAASRPHRAAKWHRYDIPAFFSWAEQASSPAEQVATPAKRPQRPTRSSASFAASDDPAAAEWLQRKTRCTQKVSKQDQRPAKEAKDQFSRHSRRSAQRDFFSQEVAAARAVKDKGARVDEERKDEIDCEHDGELSNEGQPDVYGSSSASGSDAPAQAVPQQDMSVASASGPTEMIPPTPAKESASPRHQPPKAPTKPKKKQNRRGGKSAALAKKHASREQREEDEAILAAHASRRTALLADAVTYRQSGPWRIAEASPDSLARADAPHIAEAFPVPPSGTRPTRRADAVHQKRHGRVKCFVAKQQYPAGAVTVVGHDMRIPDALRTAYGEQRRARLAVMDRRRERNRCLEAVDHLLVPVVPRLEDVFPVLEDAALEPAVHQDGTQGAPTAASTSLQDSTSATSAPTSASTTTTASLSLGSLPPDHSTTSTTTTPLALSPTRA